jgi:hypothetical protein
MLYGFGEAKKSAIKSSTLGCILHLAAKAHKGSIRESSIIDVIDYISALSEASEEEQVQSRSSETVLKLEVSESEL